MDIAKLIEFLQQYPTWFRSLVVLWAIVGVVLAGGLLFFGTKESPASVVSAPPPSATTAPKVAATGSPNPNQSLSPTAATVSSPPHLTAQTYFITLKSLSERFLEKQEFIEKNSGSIVEWEGVVDSVSHSAVGRISVQLIAQGVSPERWIFCWLPEDLKTKAYSLQKGDLARVKGKLSLSTPNMPDVEVNEITLLSARGTS